MVKVVNTTPSPCCDEQAPKGKTCRCGKPLKYKDYFLRVPPDTVTAKAGVAWTFDEPPESYNPIHQS